MKKQKIITLKDLDYQLFNGCYNCKHKDLVYYLNCLDRDWVCLLTTQKEHINVTLGSCKYHEEDVEEGAE